MLDQTLDSAYSRVRCMLYTHKGGADRGCTPSLQFRSHECSTGSIYRVVQ
nr:unnamed protein product [Callosobruchus analis]